MLTPEPVCVQRGVGKMRSETVTGWDKALSGSPAPEREALGR